MDTRTTTSCTVRSTPKKHGVAAKSHQTTSSASQTNTRVKHRVFSPSSSRTASRFGCPEISLSRKYLQTLFETSMATTAATRCFDNTVNAVRSLRKTSTTAKRVSVVTCGGVDPTRGDRPSDAIRNTTDKRMTPPLRATPLFLSDPFCDVVKDGDNKLLFRCPPEPGEDPELGHSYRPVEFDFSEAEQQMGKEPGECAIGEAEDGMPAVDCGE